MPCTRGKETRHTTPKPLSIVLASSAIVLYNISTGYVGTRVWMNDGLKISHHGRSIRIREYDYTQTGVYFVTVCTRRRNCLLGTITDRGVVPSPCGRIAKECWEEIPHHFERVELDIFAIMPNHVHGILLLCPAHESVREEARPAARFRPESFGKPVAGSLPTIIRSFKSASTKRINELRKTGPLSAWQRNYHEHAIRSQRELDRIREYISTNPLRWALHDGESPQAVPSDSFSPRIP